MIGPFFVKHNGEMELLECCKDCAFIVNDGNKDTDADCFMNPCPCMPVNEEEEEE